MNKTIVGTAAVLGALSIVLGAFAAHGLQDLISADQVSSFKTGVLYQMFHTLFLLFLGSNQGIAQKTKKQIFYLVLVGVILFSFSIYILATSSITGIDLGKAAILTPIGGAFLIAAWLWLAYRVFKPLN